MKHRLRIDFSIADKYFKEFLKNSHGLISKDERRRSENKKRGSQPFEPGRAPIKAGDGIEQMLGEFNWTSSIDRADLFSNWVKIVGPDSADASYPESFEKGVLTIRCRSTAWATQLRLLEKQILSKIQDRHQDLGVSEVRFIGPTAPSWKKGPRSVPGRGPRDTYG